MNSTHLKGSMDGSSITGTIKQLPYLLAIYLKKQNQKSNELEKGGRKKKKAPGPLLFCGRGVCDDWLVRAKQDAKQSRYVVTCHPDGKQSDRFYWVMVVAVK